jgi:riboflavin biosynthesis pyrimidine reductase
MRLLYPDAIETVDPLDVYADLPQCEGRPAVRLNMIVSADGGTSWGGVSGALGGPADKALFPVLRSFADVVLVAAGTMRAEGYGPARLSEAMQEARRARGQTSVPPIALVSRSVEFDWKAPFFAEATERPILVTVEAASETERADAAAVADVIVAGEHDVDLTKAMEQLGARGVRNVLAEGGPTLNGALASAGLLDELCLTLSPRLASGDAKRIIAGSSLEELEPLQLRSICEDDSFLFLRYRPVLPAKKS